MPNIVEGSEISGKLKKSIADDWGIDGRPVVAGGGGDNASTACGLGIKTWRCFYFIRNIGVIFLVQTLYTYCNDGDFRRKNSEKWHLMSVILL